LFVGYLSDRVDLLRRQVVEAPICFVDSNPEWLAMIPIVLLGELCNRNALLVKPNFIPESVPLLTNARVHDTCALLGEAHDV
jgi:hypothetical protein